MELNFKLYYQSKDGVLNDDPNRMGGFFTSLEYGVLFPLDVGSAGRVLSSVDVSGWIESVEEREPGVASVSAPVFDIDGTVVAAVSVSGPIDRLTRAPGERFGESVLAAAAEIARTLGTPPSN